MLHDAGFGYLCTFASFAGLKPTLRPCAGHFSIYSIWNMIKQKKKLWTFFRITMWKVWFLVQMIWKSGIVTIRAWNVYIGPAEHYCTLSNIYTDGVQSNICTIQNAQLHNCTMKHLHNAQSGTSHEIFGLDSTGLSFQLNTSSKHLHSITVSLFVDNPK